jgi:hypothetical protein
MARVSVLQLDTRFCRVPGDVGCVDSYVNDPEIIRVPRASVADVVSDQPNQIDLDPFLKAIEQASGDIIVTSCGFLSPFQDQLQSVTHKPVIASVLNMLSDLKVTKGAERSSVLTFNADRLVDAHFPNHFRAGDFHIVGLRPVNPLRQRIEGDIPDRFDPFDMQDAVMHDFAAAMTPTTAIVVLECTNLPPYKPQMRRNSDVRIVDILSAIEHIAPKTIAPQYL